MGVLPGATGGSYLDVRRGLLSWLTSTDHKRIGVLYLVSVVAFFFVAMSLGVLIRLHLWEPGSRLLGNDGYNRVLTLHGVAMIFLFIIPGIPSSFGNFFLPILIGARDVAFPRLNLASWYLYMAGATLALLAVGLGGFDTGWTFYPPYSWRTGTHVALPLFGAFLVGWSSILTGLNFITTIHRLRHRDMPWGRMPLFVWALYATSWIQVIATPVVGILLLLLVIERFFGVGIFDPSRGGDPILYQHVFWIYSHPAVYIMILPAMGVVSEIIPTFARKPIFGYKAIAGSSLAIAAIGSLVWAHHMFTSGISDQARILFSFLTFLVAVPTAIKVFNWVATLYKGSIVLEPPMVLALTFITLFSIGGLTGLFLASLAPDIHLHDTSFVVGHFHYTMFGGVGTVFFAACHYWLPKMFGRMYPKGPAYLGIALYFVGFNLTYMSLMFAGVAGMPRRYADYLPEYHLYHAVSTAGSWVLVAGVLLMAGNLLYGLKRGPRAPDNPYGGETPEWRTSSPPPHENFLGEPDLTRGPYDYPREVVR